MNLEQAYAYLEDLKGRGFILGLDNIKNLMTALGRPDRSLKFIHVAGTNGKGSVCTYLASILGASGYRTGLYTSPSIFRFSERFRIGGEEIDDEQIAELLTQIRGAAEAEDIPITAFEAETALAVLYFHEMGCEFAVMEVGLGGTLDATNFIESPLISVITRIDLDHTDFLGTTLEEIASQKAGIIKKGAPVVSYFQKPEVAAVLEETARAMESDLRYLDPDSVIIKDSSAKGHVFDFEPYQDLRIRLAGSYQPYNASLAVLVIEKLQDLGIEISSDCVLQGLYEAEIEGRFQVLHENPLFIVDGAHNAQGVEGLVETIENLFGDQKLIFIFGTLRDKDFEKSIELTLPHSKFYITTRPDSDRALSSIDLKNRIIHHGGTAIAIGSMHAAIGLALRKAQPEDVILCFGSLYQVGEVLRYFQRHKEQQNMNREQENSLKPDQIIAELSALNIGSILIGEPLKNHTTFKIGGPCVAMVLPEDYEQAAEALRYLRDREVLHMVMGNGSNLLIKDSGYPGVIVKLGENLSKVRFEGTRIIAQAGAQLTKTSKAAIERSLEGMEFSSGIPGNIGGAITMNAGAYGGEIKDIVESVKVIDPNGQIVDILAEDMNFRYRNSRVQDEGLIVLEATFALKEGVPEQIQAKYQELSEARNSKQPLEYPSAGSIFKRPPGYFAGKLIDDAGLRGYRYKNAMVSEKHCGFIVAVGPSSYEEVSHVIEHVQQVVQEKFGVSLETEVRIIGE